IMARLLFVLTHWPYFRANPGHILALWNGGLSWVGAVLGAYLGCWLIAKSWKSSIFKIADHLTVMIPPLVVFTWLACWLNGYAYGFATGTDTFWGIPIMDETGFVQDRFPLQLVAAFSMLLFAFWLETRKNQFQKEGQKMAVMHLGLVVHLLLFMPLRADPALSILDVRVDVWAALAFFLFGAATFYWLFFGPESTLQKA
ncbi:MAG: prolipoprotein diacylglyceryl transferase family protein, partial [Anaerolineaceae bacterium]